jgi:predicted RNA polymerase sigma factor
LPYVDLIVGTGALENYHLLYSVRADLLDRLDRFDEAAAEWSRAAGLSANEAERTLLVGRAEASRVRAGVRAGGGSGAGGR